ncbi:MAG: PID-CTERM protein-sorting domain-containing protein [Aquirufa sp.]
MKKLVFTLLFFSLCLGVYAQPNFPTDPQGVPVDGGLSILLGAGIGYGVKKINDHRKRK